jgi:diadenosine tetraphosphate (Ap4A) HIT family hydrolase
MHATLAKFDWPHTRLFERGPWAVLLRPRQPTFASLVVVHSTDAVRSLSTVPPHDFALFPEVCAKIESVIAGRFNASRFNYLALMMVDPHVHFHVCPRYVSPVSFRGVEFADPAWPKPVDVSSHIQVTDEQLEALRKLLVAEFAD